MSTATLGWYVRRLRRMSPSEVGLRALDESRRRLWARRQVRPGTVPPPATGVRTSRSFGQALPELLELMRQRLPWRLLIAGVAGVLAILVAAGEVSNWDVFLRFFYQVPYGESDPLYGKDIGFYLFSLPAYVVLKNWMLPNGAAVVRKPAACDGSANAAPGA